MLLGAAEGAADGCAVGAADGDALGCFVGLGVGPAFEENEKRIKKDEEFIRRPMQIHSMYANSIAQNLRGVGLGVGLGVGRGVGRGVGAMVGGTSFRSMQ